MNIIKISAVLTAALLTGALSATAFAAETLTTTTGSITFRKAIDVTNAAGAGGITGTIAFDVTAADESDLPDDGEKNYVGSVDQLDGSDIIATFAADDSGIANKESDVSVGFDTSKFEAPGVYYYHLTERDPGIHGLTATTATYLLKVRVVNDNTSEPDGATFKIDYATLTSLDDNTKSDLITNTYTTHGLTVTKALAGDWADYTDHFIFTLEITDPDADPGRMASVTVQTTSAAGVTSNAEVKPFTNGKVSFSETIRGGDVIEVTGLPTGAAYTITESGLDAEKYTTAWTLDGNVMLTERDEFIYDEMITHVPMSVHKNAKDILVIGAGDGGVVRELTRYDRVESIDLVEMDPQVIEACRAYLPGNACRMDDRRVHIYYENALKFIRKCEDEYDLIIVDSSDPFGPSEGLFTREFYGSCFNALRADGIMVNQQGSPFYAEDATAMQRSHQRIASTFPISKVYQAHIPTFAAGYWLFGFASKKYHPINDMDADAWNALNMRTRYYTSRLHVGAFYLPAFLEEMLREVEDC